MIVPAALAAAVLASGSGESSELSVYASARAWAVSASGDIQGTHLDDVGFDDAEAEPEFFAGLRAGAHHLRVSYSPIRREERGVVTGTILGLVQIDQDVAVDLAVDYLRGRYGYRLFENEWFAAEPFLEVAWLHEDTRVDNLTAALGTRSDESVVFPLPGAEALVCPSWPVHGRFQVSGIGYGGDHLLDMEVAGEAAYRWIFGAVGYRYADFRFETDRREVAGVDLTGIFVEGGVRF